MTNTEEAILEAVFELFRCQCGYDIGAPITKQHIATRYQAVLTACDEHASENDGELRVSS